MHPIIARSFGGLSRAYLFRQLMFGLIFPAIFVLMMTTKGHSMPLGTVPFLVLNTLLYPYSRFLYERVVGFVVGDNVFFVNALLMLAVKFFTMLICWAGAVFLAPVGLIYLYFYNSNPSSSTAS